MTVYKAKVRLFTNQIIYAVGLVGTVNRIPALPRFIAVIILTESDGLTPFHYDKMMDKIANTISLPDLIQPCRGFFIEVGKGVLFAGRERYRSSPVLF